MTEKRIGKIQRCTFGHGGYQDACIGLSVTLGSDKEAWGVQDFRGPWNLERSEHAKWTEEDRIRQAGEMVMTREQALEDCLRECWGAMLFADLLIEDPKVREAFAKVDAKCKELMSECHR